MTVKKRRKRKSPINGARSVMASRKEAKDSLDYFPTPPWATRALMECVFPRFDMRPHRARGTGSVWEPACGEGHMSEVLKEYFGEIVATDIVEYGGGQYDAMDFLHCCAFPVDWIITNPPFTSNATEKFILHALDLARVGVAMFVRCQILEGIGRYERLFKPHPPTLIAFFAERVPLVKGKWSPDASTATAYCWLVWMKDRQPMPPFWIPPGCRVALARPDDRARFAAWSMPEHREAAE